MSLIAIYIFPANRRTRAEGRMKIYYERHLYGLSLYEKIRYTSISLKAHINKRAFIDEDMLVLVVSC